MLSPRTIAVALASALLDGETDRQSLLQRGHRVLGRGGRWLAALIDRLQTAHPLSQRPRRRTVARFIRLDPGFLLACERYQFTLQYDSEAAPQMRPTTAAHDWSCYPLTTRTELAAWLGLSVPELDWFADRRRWEGVPIESVHRGPRLRHYRYRVLSKRFDQFRLIEAPKPRLKAIQRQILTAILNPVPPHHAAHGFRRGRSVRSFAAAHVGQAVVIRIDLQDFFPSIRLARIQTLFRCLGYPEDVADALAGLCTNTAPYDLWRTLSQPLTVNQQRQARLYNQPHLPQGAPTSPALANLAAYRLDCRLTGLAKASGGHYTRYADDLVFSGDVDFARSARRFHIHACAIAMMEGFAVHHRKTRIMRPGVRQQVAGVVVNRHLNVPRRDYDRLKAILHNCIHHGPASQNRDHLPDFRSHLLGRISFVAALHPSRGQRLQDLFAQIVW